MELLCEIDLQSFLQINLPTAMEALLSGRKVEEKKLLPSALSPRNMVEHPKESLLMLCLNISD